MKTVSKIIVLLSVGFVIGACKPTVEPPVTPTPITYTVIFNGTWGSNTDPKIVKTLQGNSITLPNNPYKRAEPVRFAGWYTSNTDFSEKNAFTANTEVQESMEVFARWESIDTNSSMRFTLNRDGETYEVEIYNSDYSHIYDKNIVLPSVYLGKKVTHFKVDVHNHSEGLSNIESITLSNHITFIEEYSFSSLGGLKEISVEESNTSFMSDRGVLYSKDKKTLLCYPHNKSGEVKISTETETIEALELYPSDITSITIPNNVTSIETLNLGGSIKTIYISDNVVNIGDITLGKNIENFIIPSSVEKIETISFGYDVEEFIIPDGIKSFGAITGGFVKKVHLGKNLQELGNSFISIASIETITVDANNNYFYAEENVLYSKDKTELIRVAPKKVKDVFEIPTTVTKVSEDAFYDCYNIGDVIIPKSVTTIEHDAFSDFGANSITLSNNVETLAYWVFWRSGETTVYVESTEKLSGWHGSWLSSGTIIWGCTMANVDYPYVISIEKSSETVHRYAYGQGDEIILAPTRKGYTFKGWSISENSTTVSYTADKIEAAPNGTKLYAVWEVK